MIRAAEFREIPFGRYMEVPQEAILEKGDDVISLDSGNGLVEKTEAGRLSRLLKRKFVQGQARRVREKVPQETYIPAHFDFSGRLVESGWVSAERWMPVTKEGQLLRGQNYFY